MPSFNKCGLARAIINFLYSVQYNHTLFKQNIPIQPTRVQFIQIPTVPQRLAPGTSTTHQSVLQSHLSDSENKVKLIELFLTFPVVRADAVAR
jgi:hypothetical protein